MTEPTIHQAEKFLIFDKRQTGNKIFVHEEDEHFLVHGFYHFKHFSCESPVRFMLHSPANHAFISLHTDNKVTFYRPKCYREIIWKKMPFLGLTPTKLLGWIIGWGPGPIFTLLDNELRHLDTADNALDIRLCEAVEHSWEMVTAGIGNVCVWSVLLMRCRVMIQEGLQQRAFTHMALAPPQKKRPHCAIVACGKDVTVIDLDNGIVLDHQEELAPSEITAMLFCTHLNCLITGFEDYAITVWGLDWVPCVTFFGHDGVVNSLFYCSKSNLLISCSADCTIRSWDVKRNLAIDCFHTEHNNPPLCLGGIKNEHPFFSFSEKGVDLWFLTAWYTLHTKIKGDENIALKHILVSHLPPCYPTRVTCVSEDDHIYLVSVGTEEILTSFKAGKRVLCAAYCLQKELLFVLTQCGSLLQVNPLTNPATLIQEWEGKGQAPWTSSDTISKKDVLNLPVPGPACCMVIYSSLGDPEKALEKWKSLQSRRGSIHRDTKQIDHFKNRFWVIIGQIGGCVSVLAMDDGTILFRTPAHNGNNVTAVKAYPKNNCLLSSGADFTVIVWRVHPDAATCLTKNQMVICYERQVYLAALELYVALEFQEPNSNFYSLQLYHMENLKRAECQQNNAHIDSLTGVCAIPEIKAFASCSLDKTVRIWNEKNKLIWVQQLVAAPQCMEYSGNGELFLGMNGDLYRLEFAQFLPKKYRRKFRCYYFENVLPELPIAEVEETPDKEDTSVAETERLKEAIISNEVMNIYLEQEMEATMIIDMDAKALIKGEVVCTQKRTHSTNKTKKEAFDHFMRELYGLSPCEQIGEEDEENFEDIIMATKARLMRAIYVPKPKPVVHPAVTTEEPAETEKQVSKKKVAKKAATGPQLKTVVAKQAQAKVEKMEKVKGRYTQMDKVKKLSSTVESIQVTPQFRRSPQKPQVPSILLPVPTPAQTQKISQVTPSVVSQFSRTEWFSDVFPDRKHIGSDTTSENVFQQLLKYVQNSNGKANSKVLEAVRAAKALQSQNLFDVTDKQYTNLTEAWEKFIRPSMSNQAREVVVEMLNLLVDLKPEVSSNLAKKLIIFMANKELNLQRPILRLIEGLSVHQAHFLEHEFQNWGEGLESNPNKLEIIDKKADCWLEKWTSKFKVYNRFQNTETSSQWKRPSFSGLDVLKFFWLRWVPRELYGALLEAAFACCRPLSVGELVQRWPERTLRVGGRRKTGQTTPSRLCIQALLLAVVRGLADQRSALQVLDVCGLQGDEGGMGDPMGGWSLTVALCTMVIQAKAGAHRTQRKEGDRERKRFSALERERDLKRERGQRTGLKELKDDETCREKTRSKSPVSDEELIKGVRRRMEMERKRGVVGTASGSKLETEEKETDWEVLVQVRADIFVNARSWDRVRLALSTSGPLKLQCRYLRVEEISVTSIRTLLNLLPRRTLLGIDIRYSSLGVAGLAELLPLLSTFPELNSLRLHYCNLDIRRDNLGQEGALRDLSQGLSNLQELRQLSLTALRLPGQLRVLLSSLPQPLEVLELPYLSLSPADLAYLSCSHHVSSLLQLDLSENCLDETMVPSIRRLLCQASSSLQHLSLSGCGLTDGLLGMLLSSLGGCWALKSLALALNPLSRAGLCELMRTAARMPCLRLLLYPNPLEDYQPGLPELPSSTQLLEWPLDESIDNNTTGNELSKVIMDSGRSDLLLTCDLLNFDKDMVD